MLSICVHHLLFIYTKTKEIRFLIFIVSRPNYASTLILLCASFMVLCKTLSFQTYATLLTQTYFPFPSLYLLWNYFPLIPNPDCSFQKLATFSSVSIQFSFLTSSKPKIKIFSYTISSAHFTLLYRIFFYLSFHFFTVIPFAYTPYHFVPFAPTSSQIM
jgi:hypothetical protein